MDYGLETVNRDCLYKVLLTFVECFKVSSPVRYIPAVCEPNDSVIFM